MPCSNCTEVRPIPICFANLTIGTVASDTTHTVYLKNLSTQRELAYSVTSDGTDLILDRDSEADNIKLIPGQWYELRATLATATDVTTNVNITIDSVAYTCLLIKFTEASGS